MNKMKNKFRYHITQEQTKGFAEKEPWDVKLENCKDTTIEIFYRSGGGGNWIRKTEKNEIMWYNEKFSYSVYTSKDSLFEKLEKSYQLLKRENKLKRILK